MDPISRYPKDIALYTFSFLNIYDLAKCTKVNKKWRQIACDSLLWGPLIESLFPRFLETKPKEMSVHQYFATRSVATLDQLNDHIHTTFHKVKKGHRYGFRCYFPPDLPECVLDLDFGFYKELKVKTLDFSLEAKGFKYVRKIKRKPIDSREYCVFMGKLPTDDTFCSSGKTYVKEHDHTEYGLESHINIKCKLTSFQSSTEFANSINLCIPNRVSKNYVTLYIPKKGIKKKDSGCIIA
jgi:hypothetical protein